ncbi:unnamed protein product [Heligmosomoides polygyrus]|uniref:Uncharacterized protein n=1 Tax=Heligmosomoides polygyrus TaxID=6339 RepID=A0A3P8AM44_HELPZ|nr:unnamed protein product [Heligmosomoides polygyrus]
MVPLWGILLIFCTTTWASYCGKSGVPFSIEVLPSGSPVLGCAQPSCVAQPPDDVDDSVFNTDETGQIDGFFREGDKTHQGYLQTNKLRANCSGTFDHLACTRKNQWVGGIEYIYHPRQPLLLQCCTFEGLRFSQIVGVTPIGPGEAVTGGEVVRDGRQISFDVIANIRKVVDRDDPKIKNRRLKLLERPGSFGAPIFNPTEDVTHQPHYPRRTITPKPRPTIAPIPVTPSPTTTPPPSLFTFPTLPPLSFPSLPPPTSLFMFPGFSQPNAPSPLPPATQLHASGVQQAPLAPLSPPSQTYQHLHPFMQPHLLQSPFHPFASQQLIINPGQDQSPKPLHEQSQNHQHQLGMPMAFAQPIASPFYHPFGLPAHPQQALPMADTRQMMFPFQTANLAQNNRQQVNEKAELVEPSLPPTQQQLGNLFQPPPFPALHTALQNFQSQG